ncbi:MAG: hypothetical protein IKV73_03760, partial [Clostridia bacterium]|nr:hypothetical protein [Clostridia bacterium]
MNSKLDIIPSPKYCCYASGSELGVSKVYYDLSFGERIEAALSLLAKKADFKITAAGDADLIITCDTAAYFDSGELEFFGEK